MNLPTAKLWDLFEGRSKAVLADRLRQLSDHVVKIESVVIDPYVADNTAVRELTPMRSGWRPGSTSNDWQPKLSPMCGPAANKTSPVTEAGAVTRSARRAGT